MLKQDAANGDDFSVDPDSRHGDRYQTTGVVLMAQRFWATMLILEVRAEPDHGAATPDTSVISLVDRLKT